MDRPRAAGNGEKSRMLPQGSAAAAQLRLAGEAKCGIFIEKCGCIARARALDREQLLTLVSRASAVEERA